MRFVGGRRFPLSCCQSLKGTFPLVSLIVEGRGKVQTTASRSRRMSTSFCIYVIPSLSLCVECCMLRPTLKWSTSTLHSLMHSLLVLEVKPKALFLCPLWKQMKRRCFHGVPPSLRCKDLKRASTGAELTFQIILVDAKCRTLFCIIIKSIPSLYYIENFTA